MEKVKIKDMDGAKKFHKWYSKIFVKIVHAHHDNEEHIYFPWIESKAGSLPSKLCSDHKTLMAMVAEIGEAAKKGAANDTASWAALPGLITKFNAEITAHLAEEEEGITPILKDPKHNITFEEHKKIIDTIIKSEGLGISAKFLPAVMWAMDEAGPNGYGGLTREVFRRDMPGPIRFLCNTFWEKKFQKKSLGVLRSLQA